jgi:hypothetical protein
MRWPTALLLAALGTAGCRNSQPTSDPFFPRTTIPPPPTGSATGAPDAYYTNPTPPLNGSAPQFIPPSTGAPAASPPSNFYSPPGGFQYQQPSPTMAPGASGYAPTPGPAPRGSTSMFQPTGEVTTAQYDDDTSQTTIGQVPRMKQAKYVRTADTQPSAVYERGGTVDAGTSPPALASDDTSSDPIDIMDLPPVQRSSR